MTIRPIAPNQTEVHTDDGKIIFYSYSTPVAAFIPGEGYLKTDQKHSVTTSKHVNAWAGKNAPTRPQSYFDSLK